MADIFLRFLKIGTTTTTTCPICCDERKRASRANPCRVCAGTAGAVRYCDECYLKIEEAPCPYCFALPEHLFKCVACKMPRTNKSAWRADLEGYLCRNCNLIPNARGDMPSIWGACFAGYDSTWKAKFFASSFLLHVIFPWGVPFLYLWIFHRAWTPLDRADSVVFRFMRAIFIVPMVFMMGIHSAMESYAFTALVGVIFANSMMFSKPRLNPFR